MNSVRLAGVLAAVVTPFAADLSPDPVRYLRHCKWLLANGCTGLVPFGTTSEANSLSADERMVLLEQLVQGGVPASSLMPGTGTCALTDSVRLTRHAVALGCAGTLMLPPFYYKGVSDQGLYRNYAEVIERVGDGRLRLYLYHIPPVSQVGISLALIERLLQRYPVTVAGVKDSSGDWNNTRAVLDACAHRDFDIFSGSEAVLLQNLRAGGAGCIAANANVNPAAIHRLYRGWRSDDAERIQAEVSAIRSVLQQYPMIAAHKATIAHYTRDPGWAALRPPLLELTPGQAGALTNELASRGFDMPGLGA